MESIDTNQEVFNTLCELVTHDDFQAAQKEYMEHHVASFDHEDENKLQYTAIYEGYAKLLETTLELKLQESFSDEQVKTFYGAFKKNFNHFRSQNSEACDTLIDFLDFSKFKATMLQMKDAIGADAQVSADPGPGALGKQLNVEYFHSLLGENVDDPEVGWTKKTSSTDEGLGVQMTIHARPIKGSKVQMLRSDCIFKKATKEQFATFMVNIEQNMKDDPMMRECKVIARHPDGIPAQYYWKMKMTGASERDSVCSFEKHVMDDGRSIFITKSIDHPDYPPNKKIVRLDLYTAGHSYEEGEDLRYIEFAYLDMRGWFPPRLMNMMIGSMATQQVKEMAKKLKKQ